MYDRSKMFQDTCASLFGVVFPPFASMKIRRDRNNFGRHPHVSQILIKQKQRGPDVWVTLGLTCAGYFPGLIHAGWIIFHDPTPYSRSPPI